MKRIAIALSLIFNLATPQLHAKSIVSTNVSLKGITESTYLEARNRRHHETKLEVVTDLNVAKKLLKGVVWFGQPNDIPAYPVNDESKVIRQIKMKNGAVILGNKDKYMEFLAYYPTEHYLAVEREYPAAFGYDLISGLDESKVGVPDDFADSPSGIYRVSGAYNGEECHGYILRRKNDKKARVIYAFSIDVACRFSERFWTDNRHFYFSTEFNLENGAIKHSFYKLTVHDVPK
jgi:hypothetical protein